MRSWFVYRSPFNDFDNLGRVIEWIRARKDVPYIRVFLVMPSIGFGP
ncbi:hypothetical protein [Vulcanisaeta sp. JCM 14467]|nr:hypothetical protein [Vulcanisaeta sp. JCM 14467]